MEILVIKRDGSSDRWSFDKLVTSIVRAGIPVKEAENIANTVKAWVEQSAKDGKIESTEIKYKIVETLKPQYPVEAINFETYKKE